MEAVAPAGKVDALTVDHCVFQGNGRNGRTRAEVQLQGWIFRTKLRDCWIENGGDVDVGVRMEAGEAIARPRGGVTEVRRYIPNFVTFERTIVALMPRAAEFVDCHQCGAEGLIGFHGPAYWLGRPDGGSSTYCSDPRGGAVVDVGLRREVP